MTASIASKLQTNPSAHIVHLIVGLVLGLCIAIVMFWGLQKLILGGETISASLKTAPNMNVSTFQNDAKPRRYLLPEVKPTPQQASKPLPGLLDSANETVGAIDIQSPVIDPKDFFTGGFSLGVGEGDYLPIIIINKLQHRPVKTLSPFPQLDGYCTIQNPAPRAGAAKDSTILKGNCPLSSGG
jgi:hypothetical protein